MPGALFALSVATWRAQGGSLKTMKNNGFGFSFNIGDNDDDRNQNNPMGGLGDMLNQFGQMLSGMGSTMNSPEGQGAVNYALAERIARQQLGKVAPISSSDERAVEESIALAELWLDDATILPASGNKVQAWNATDWLEQSLPMWKRLVTPVAEQMNQAQLDSMPEEAREMVGPMLQVMNQMSSMNFGMQLGNALGDLATQTIAGSDFALPVAPAGTTAVLPKNLSELTSALGQKPQDVMVYLSAREAARQRLFRHVPWLVEQIVTSVEEYAAGLSIDTSHIEETVRELNLDSGDPAAIQDAMAQLQGMDLSPRITSSNQVATARLETLLALIEGWVDHVTATALSERMPAAGALAEAWRRRRATGGSADKVLSQVVSIDIAAPNVSQAAELWRRVDVAVGTERRDHIWDHPDLLPEAKDLESSAEFIDGLLGDDFDPIAEINELEKLLEQEGQKDQDSKSAEDSKDPEDKDDPQAN